MNRKIMIIITIALLISACSFLTPSSMDIETAIAQTQASQPQTTDTTEPTHTVISDTPILGDPRSYVLTLADLPTGFSYFEERIGHWSNESIAAQHDNPEEFLAQLEEWGRLDGFFTAYEKSGFGTSYIRNLVVIMESSEGAQAYYAYLANEDVTEGWIPVSMPTLADEAYATTRTDLDENDDRIQWTLYRVTFRKRNVIGEVYTAARSGYAIFDDALSIARKLESRISDTPPETIVPLLPTDVATSNLSQTPTPIAILVEETQELGPIWDETRDEVFTVHVSLHSVRFDSGDEFSKPKQGYTYVIVDVTIKNLGPSAVRSIGEYNFQVQDANGALRASGWIPGTDDCIMDLVDLSVGGSVSGCFGFEVPIEGDLELIYAPYKYLGLEPDRYLSFNIRQ